jgi:NADH-quinone oxidoreductase subunit L
MASNTIMIATVATTFVPLLASAIILLATRRRATLSAAVSLAAGALSLLGAIALFVLLRGLEAPLTFSWRWLLSGQIAVRFGYQLDALSLLMLLIVAAISFLVQFYSLGYMAHDPGKARYFGFLSLFAWAMLNLTTAATLLQLFVFWELVGLSSYLLIGFWYEKFSASEAGKKAFVMTRLGDVAFLLGILLLTIHLGQLDIAGLEASAGRMAPGLITGAALLILGGIVGKSAQFPLLTWLPDAMEGPTPVSALLHSATMVAAGVYLMARLFPFFSLSPLALFAALLIGTLSLLLASTMALVSRDIKQVWAFSTISQLGFMLMGLGAGGYTAGIFHLTTHAAFKALLFLCAGVFLHTYESNDMYTIGRAGGRKLTIPFVCMVVGALALAGLPPFSGFFSKEAILNHLAALPNPVWLVAGLLGAFLTAYYTFRLVFVIGRPAATEGARTVVPGHPIDPRNTRIMALPLIVLAALTLVLGWFQRPLENSLASAAAAQAAGHVAWLPYAAVALAVAGVALAWYEFGRRAASQIGFTERLPALARLFGSRWYLDHFYRRLLDTVVYHGFSRWCTRNDQIVIDGSLDGLASGTIGSGRGLGWLHAVAIQSRLTIFFAVILLLAVYLLARGYA